MSKPLKRYRWDHPGEWLAETQRVSMFDLAAWAREHMDADQIQEAFQSEMEADGYFDELDENGNPILEEENK